MLPHIQYIEIRELIEAAGFDLSYVDDIPMLFRISDRRLNHPDDEVIVQAIIDNYDHLPVLKSEKIAELHAEGVRQMSFIYSFIDNVDYYLFLRDLYMSMVPAARAPLDGNLLQIKKIKDAFDAAKTAINAMTLEADVIAYDVTTNPVWP
mgnify:CR=1 FL=1